LLAVLICALVTALNNYQKEKQFRKLNVISETNKTCTVIREHETHVINYNEIVTGDIMYIREGMEIPVDGWLIEAAEIYVDESSMTGESEPVAKNILENCLNAIKKNHKGDYFSPVMVSGTKVAAG
jgi:Ca2+ transporting ATPase